MHPPTAAAAAAAAVDAGSCVAGHGHCCCCQVGGGGGAAAGQMGAAETRAAMEAAACDVLCSRSGGAERGGEGAAHEPLEAYAGTPVGALSKLPFGVDAPRDGPLTLMLQMLSMRQCAKAQASIEPASKEISCEGPPKLVKFAKKMFH
eukprot:1160346-Pelagomonas_calceolata.AAC.5